MAYRNNNIESAELFFIKSLELSPKDIELYKTLANLYLSTGEMEKAAALYEDALLANPGNPNIQQDLAMLYKEMIAKAGRA
jgi:Flp pilus assembly protein TadD